MKICTKSALNPRIWAENSENFNKIGDVSETDASHVHMLFAQLCLCVMNI